MEGEKEEELVVMTLEVEELMEEMVVRDIIQEITEMVVRLMVL